MIALQCKVRSRVEFGCGKGDRGGSDSDKVESERSRVVNSKESDMILVSVLRVSSDRSKPTIVPWSRQSISAGPCLSGTTEKVEQRP